MAPNESRRSPDEILAEIEREERRLADLRAEAERAALRIAELRAALASAKAVANAPLRVAEAAPATTEQMTPDAKVDLFRSLFRGRPDVFPRRWENARTGRSGYSPACSNEWVPGVCAKKGQNGRVRSSAVCGDCRQQAFLPVTNAELRKHLWNVGGSTDRSGPRPTLASLASAP